MSTRRRSCWQIRDDCRRAGIANARSVHADWLDVEPPEGTVALVNHVTYLTRDIVTFVEKLERAAYRRVLLTVNSPPPPTWNRDLYPLVHGEPEALVPGHHELVPVLWEMGIERHSDAPGPGGALSDRSHAGTCDPGGGRAHRERAVGALAELTGAGGARSAASGNAVRGSVQPDGRWLRAALDRYPATRC